MTHRSVVRSRPKPVAAGPVREKRIHDGEVLDYADLARLGHVTRARLTQIMNLVNLAPDIQDEILFLPAVTEGNERR